MVLDLCIHFHIHTPVSSIDRYSELLLCAASSWLEQSGRGYRVAACVPMEDESLHVWGNPWHVLVEKMPPGMYLVMLLPGMQGVFDMWSFRALPTQHMERLAFLSWLWRVYLRYSTDGVTQERSWQCCCLLFPINEQADGVTARIFCLWHCFVLCSHTSEESYL